MTAGTATVVKVVQHSIKNGTSYYLVVCFDAGCTYVHGPDEFMRADQLRTAHRNLHMGSRSGAEA